MRIVSLCPSNTEILGFMGLARNIVGVDNYSDWPEEVNMLPRLGPDLDINMDAVEALKPDLIVASLSVPGMEKNISRLEERGLPFIILNPNSLEEIGEDLLAVGEATGQEILANKAYLKYKGFLEKFSMLSVKVQEKPSLYWEWWPKPVFTPGGENWLTEISALAGGRNVFADVRQASVKTDWEDVLNRDPDYILMAWVGVKEQMMKPELLRKRPGWPEMDALKNNRIYVMEESLYCRPSPRLLLGLQRLGAMLHPDIFPVFDAEEGEEWLCQHAE
jgi:iron complex transport system substrate-binding protein